MNSHPKFWQRTPISYYGANKKYGWHQKEISMHLVSSNSGKKRLEILTANYPI